MVFFQIKLDIFIFNFNLSNYIHFSFNFFLPYFQQISFNFSIMDFTGDFSKDLNLHNS